MTTSNVQQQLIKNKSRRITADELIIEEAFHVINEEFCHEREIEQRLSGLPRPQAPFSWANLEPSSIFSSEDIRKTCIQYRLRFLDSKKFKGEIPYEAILKLKALEKEHGVALSEFKIMAPDSRFQLEDCDKDPLLFVKLSDRYYYLVHQWGGDLAWYRKIIMWPLQSFTTLALTVAAISLVLSLLVPTELLLGGVAAQSGFARLALFFWFLVSITSMVTYIGFAFFKNVTSKQWNSPFFKQEF